MIEMGTIKPKPEVVAGTKRLVAGLSALQPDSGIKVEIHDGKVHFIEVGTNNLVAEFEFSPSDSNWDTTQIE
jgi:serine protease inhibitor ecotin